MKNIKNKVVLFLLPILLRGGILLAQSPVPVVFFEKSSVQLDSNDAVFNKKIPSQYDTAIRLALRYFPQLKDRRITFRTRKTIVPFTSRPTVWSVFRKPEKRRYLITISTGSTPFLSKIIMDSLSFNAQIGVIGHEISHVLEFDQKKGGFFLGLILKQANKKAMDTFEYNTDKRTIEQGLGYQLLAWSKDVREKLHISSFNRAKSPSMHDRERYMHPPTIEKHIDKMPIYGQTQ